MNIFAFVGTNFFKQLQLNPLSSETASDMEKQNAARIFSFILTLVFGAANAIFSAMAYFLIERDERSWLRNVQGRRALLILSLLGGALSLLAMGLCLRIGATHDAARLGLFILWLIVFTFWYSPGLFMSHMPRNHFLIFFKEPELCPSF